MQKCIQVDKGGVMSDKSENLENLESKRKKLFNEISKLGDFRRGTISVNFRKCGKPTCKCAKPGNIGHGPQYLWNTTIEGKSYAKNLKLGSELQKYTEETENYKKFKNLSKQIIEINEKICNLTPVKPIANNDVEDLKKKLQKYYKQKLKKK
jgi:hypothetical protein